MTPTMGRRARSNQEILLWGSSKTIDLHLVDGAVTIALPGRPSAQLLNPVVEYPTVFLIQYTVSCAGFQNETNPLTVNFVTHFGVGQANDQIVSPSFVLAAADGYAPQFDQGFLPAMSVQTQAFVSGGPFNNTAAHHSVTVSAMAASMSGGGQLHQELAAIRELLEGALSQAGRRP